MSSLSRRTVWITGASAGIGEALAIQAVERGAKVVLTARRREELERVRAACVDPARAAVLPADLLADDFDPDALHREAAAAFGPIDMLVNNAGLSQRSRVQDTGMGVYRRLMELDYFVPVELTRAVLPGMLARGGGHLVAISSVAGKLGVPLRSGYCAAKHALHGFFDALRAETYDEGIRVTLACPGFVRTQVSVNALGGDGRPHGQMDEAIDEGIPPAACAEAIWRAVEAEREEILIGRERWVVRLRALWPGLVSRLMRRAKVT